MTKNHDFQQKRFKFNSGFDNQKNLLIFCLVPAIRNQNQKILDFLSRFCLFLAQKWPNLKKSIFEIWRAKISKMGEKIRSLASESFFIT